jgi:hypothetical protein
MTKANTENSLDTEYSIDETSIELSNYNEKLLKFD